MIQVIVNADDFGLTEGVTRGIVEAIHHGAVTSTTAMACVPGAAARLHRWAPEVRGRIGAHLQLTGGRPIRGLPLVPTLASTDGAFPPSKQDLRAAHTEEIIVEWDAQFRFLLDLGIEPTHIDTHQHVHKFPNVFDAFLEIARRFGVPARALNSRMQSALRLADILSPDAMIAGFYREGLTSARLLALLEAAAAGTPAPPAAIEVMCHPGMASDGLCRVSKYVAEREIEMAALCDPDLRVRLAEKGFELIGYSSLSTRTPAALRLASA